MRCNVGGGSDRGRERWRGGGRGEKKSGDGRNKYLKERLPSQPHRAEMWKRQSKQAWSLGWLGVFWGERKTEEEWERERKRERET